jgi:tetratricopeptide (TPR) repeat protein
MIHQKKYRNILLFILIIAFGLFVVSCGPKVRKPVGEMDTPAHHTYVGVKLLDQGKYVEAAHEFDLALQLDMKYAQAHAGLGLAKAYQGDFKAAFEAMKLAKRHAASKEDKIVAHVGFIRLYTMNRAVDKGWIDKVKNEYGWALQVDPNAPAVYYYTGRAYKEALDFGQAGQMFAKVLELKGDYINEADTEWNLVQKIQRAMPGTIAGKKIAILERITRADAAALFMEELRIDILYKKRTLKTFDTDFKDPEKAKAASAAAVPMATDIADHPLKVDIEDCLKIGVRGLENYPDGTFRPGELVDRATYAMMVEDILIKVTGDNALATKFIGTTSPFPDLRSDLPYFNAVMVVTSRGIMGPLDITSGEFAPLKPVPGVDALLIIRKMKEELKFF